MSARVKGLTHHARLGPALCNTARFAKEICESLRYVTVTCHVCNGGTLSSPASELASASLLCLTTLFMSSTLSYSYTLEDDTSISVTQFLRSHRKSDTYAFVVVEEAMVCSSCCFLATEGNQ